MRAFFASFKQSANMLASAVRKGPVSTTRAQPSISTSFSRLHAQGVSTAAIRNGRSTVKSTTSARNYLHTLLVKRAFHSSPWVSRHFGAPTSTAPAPNLQGSISKRGTGTRKSGCYNNVLTYLFLCRTCVANSESW